MKIRRDFVTNSSSSSFVVLFDKKPKNKPELAKMLDLPCYLEDGDNCFSSSEVVDRIFRDIEDVPGSYLIEIYDPTAIDCFVIESVTEKEMLIDQITQHIVDSCGEYHTKQNFLGEDFVTPLDSCQRFFDKYGFRRYGSREYIESPLEKQEEYKKEMKNIYKKVTDECKKIAQDLALKILEKYKDKFILMTEYESDGDSAEWAICNYSVFKNVPCECLRLS